VNDIYKDSIEYIFGNISSDDWVSVVQNELTPPLMLPKWRGWQPIETAPRGGTEILTIRSNGYIRNAKWYNNPFGRKDTVIDDADGKWWSVTHWMPLPPPPTD
jgi:hypothetical protein